MSEIRFDNKCQMSFNTSSRAEAEGFAKGVKDSFSLLQPDDHPVITVSQVTVGSDLIFRVYVECMLKENCL